MKPSRTGLVSAGALAVVLAVLIIVLATSDSAGERKGNSPLLGKAAPELAGEVVYSGAGDDVATFDALEARGSWLLVNFFGTFCIPCRIEHPELVAFAADNPDSVQVVSVVFDDEPEDVRAFFEENGGEWPVVDDPDGAIATRWGVARVPESYLVSPGGTVVSKITGGVRAEELQELLDRLQGGA